MKSPKILVELFYDVISPYSWLAFETLCRYRGKWDIDLKFMPFVLGKVMKETGNRGPAMVAQKSLYMNHDIERLKEYYQVPVGMHEQDDVLEVESMKAVAKQCGLSDVEVKDALDRLNHQDTKDRLKYYTNKALEYGAFGSPTIVAHINNKPELFFGSDRMELMAHMMGKTWVGPNPA